MHVAAKSRTNVTFMTHFEQQFRMTTYHFPDQVPYRAARPVDPS